MTPRVANGLDVLADAGFAPLRGRRVGAICNPTAVDRRLHHLADRLHAAPGVHLAALFGPEHGIRGDAQDMVGVESSVDADTGVPVHSLYGSDPSSLTPAPEQLDGLDCLVFDVQDVGSRYYTFATSMLYAMRTCSLRGLTFFVLDRPNPIGGAVVEGPTLRPGFESFVGPHSIPVRHGLTVGELARLYAAELAIDLDLLVIPCRGLSRSLLWAETGLRWVMPSPNMPTPETALVYPGGCLIEGTNLSEGRGTTRPFELWGAPWLAGRLRPDDPEVVAHGGGAGALLRPCAFRPVFHKHAGRACHGLQPHVVEPETFRSTSFYARMIALAHRRAGDAFAWRTEPYEFVREPIAIDLLFGSAREREAIESGLPLADWSDIEGEWAAESAEFARRREPFLLYQ